MAGRKLRHEHYIDLKIRLDRLAALEDRCRDGLSLLVAGGMTRDDYLMLLNQHTHAQRDWERRHRTIFDDPDA